MLAAVEAGTFNVAVPEPVTPVAAEEAVPPVMTITAASPEARARVTKFDEPATPAAVVPEDAPTLSFETVNAPTAAFAETAENPPRVSATAATAAMRLMLVFVDIIFLSEKVDLENFSISAWPTNTDS